MKYELGIMISGRVMHGDNYGKRLGFPTANLDRRMYRRRKFRVNFGIYAGWAIVGPAIGSPRFALEAGRPLSTESRQALPGPTNAKRWSAAIVIGPLDKKGLPKIEAHLLGFRGDLYGRTLTIELRKFIRPFKRYASEAALKKQIGQDVIKVKDFLGQ